jgi:phage baseplate assembly protein V
MLANETKSNIERIQEYGFSSHPLPGSQAVAVFIGGSRDHGVIVATDDSRYRIALQPGEAAIYSHEGHTIKLKNGGIIELNGTNINLNCETMAINATNSVEINSPETNSTGDISASGISLTNHVHTGVETGPNNTGTPI